MKKLSTILLLLLPLLVSAQTYNRIGVGGLPITNVIGALSIGGGGGGGGGGENTLTNSVAASWAMDETGNITREDSSPNNRDLSVTGTVTNQPGIIGNAAAFYNNSSYYLAANDNDAWSASAGRSLTVGTWFYLSNTNANQMFISKRGSSNGSYEWEINYNKTANAITGQFFTNGASGEQVYIARNIPLNTWQFALIEIDATNKIGVVWEGASGSIMNVSTSAVFSGWGPTGLGTNTGSTLWVGKTQVGGPVSGRIDNTTIWNRLLTPAEKTNWITAKQYPFN